MTIHIISLFNKSSYPAEDNLAKIAKAIDHQIAYHVAPAWGLRHIKVVANLAPNLDAGIYPIYLFDNADVAGALGYHDETADGMPYGRIFLNVIMENGGTWFDGDLSISAVYSHEAIELRGDIDVNDWRSDFNGRLYAVELCDPVEADSYKYHDISLSNFVFPEWFNAQGNFTRFDYMKTLSSPFSMSNGGYVIFEKEGQANIEYGENYPEFKKETKTHPASRTYKRLK